MICCSCVPRRPHSPLFIMFYDWMYVLTCREQFAKIHVNWENLRRVILTPKANRSQASVPDSNTEYSSVNHTFGEIIIWKLLIVSYHSNSIEGKKNKLAIHETHRYNWCSVWTWKFPKKCFSDCWRFLIFQKIFLTASKVQLWFLTEYKYIKSHWIVIPEKKDPNLKQNTVPEYLLCWVISQWLCHKSHF